jgi:hypothetical protein
MSLKEQSEAVYDRVTAPGRLGALDESYNRRFLIALESEGWTLLPIEAGQKLKPDAPVQAPLPWTSGWQYPYPSLIAPIRLDPA